MRVLDFTTLYLRSSSRASRWRSSWVLLLSTLGTCITVTRAEVEGFVRRCWHASRAAAEDGTPPSAKVQ